MEVILVWLENFHNCIDVLIIRAKKYAEIYLIWLPKMEKELE